MDVRLPSTSQRPPSPPLPPSQCLQQTIFSFSFCGGGDGACLAGDGDTGFSCGETMSGGRDSEFWMTSGGLFREKSLTLMPNELLSSEKHFSGEIFHIFSLTKAVSLSFPHTRTRLARQSNTKQAKNQKIFNFPTLRSVFFLVHVSFRKS